MPKIMTSRERILAAFNHKEPDRTPIFEYVLQSPIADAILGRPYAVDHFAEIENEKGWETAVKQSAIDRLDIAKILGHDMMYVTPNPGKPEERKKNTAEESLGYFDDPVEEVKARLKKANPKKPFNEDIFLIYKALKEEMAKRKVDLPVFVPAYAHGTWTDVALMQAMLLEPDVAKQHFENATINSTRLAEKYLSLGLDIIGVGGDFAGNRGPMVSPESYKTFMMPEIKKVAQFIRSKGGYSVNASDGNLWSVIEDFLIGCDVDGYTEIELKAGMDLGKLKNSYGEKITFLGNIDCSTILVNGTVEEVKKHMIETIEKGRGKGGHILCSNNAITSSVPLKNYMAINTAYREYFGLPGVKL